MGVCGDPTGHPVHWRSALIDPPGPASDRLRERVAEAADRHALIVNLLVAENPLLPPEVISEVSAIPTVTYTNPVEEGAEALARKYRAASAGDVAPAVSVDDFVALADLVAKMARAIR